MSEKGHRPVVRMKTFVFHGSAEHELPYPWNPISVVYEAGDIATEPKTTVIAIRRCRSSTALCTCLISSRSVCPVHPVTAESD